MADEGLRILQVNTFDTLGGAARTASALHVAYRADGHRSWLAVGQKLGADPAVLAIPNRELRGAWAGFWWRVASNPWWVTRTQRPIQMLRRVARVLAEPERALAYYRGVEYFHYPGTRRLLTLPGQRPDIVHAHNLHGGYFDLRALPRLSHQVPFVLTLHDSWLLSGHCAHSFECARWQLGCGHCPDLSIYPAIRRDSTAGNWRRKQEIYGKSRLFISTPSRWLMARVERSMLARAVVEARVIPNGVDLRVFQPADRRRVRDHLTIPQDASVLLFAANIVRQNMWKDYPTMRDAVALAARRLDGRRVLFVALGDDGPPERVGPVDVRFVPYQSDPAMVAKYYQAADVYVHAARADTFPNTILEAQACGTPVVATAVGGIPEQVDDGRTGYLVPGGDVHGMATYLVQLLSDDAVRASMGKQAAHFVREQFDLRQQVDSYLAWYASLVARPTITETRGSTTDALPNPR